MVRTVNRQWRNKERARRIGRIAASFARAVAATLVAQRVPAGDRARTRRRRLGRPRDRPDRAAGGARRGRPGRGRRRGPADRRAARGAAAAAQRAGRRRPPRQPGSPAGRAVAAPGCHRSAGCCRRLARTPSGSSASGRSTRWTTDDTRLAFEQPAAELGVTFESDAVDELVELSRRVPVLHPELRQARVGRRRRLADRTRRRGRCRRPAPTASSSTRSSGPATTGPRRPSGATCTPWPSSATARCPRTDVAARLGHDQPSRSRPSATGSSPRD